MLNQNEYVPNAVAAAAGARIGINPPGLRPYPFSEGYSVGPNTETDFALRLLEITRLPQPYTSDCWMDWTDSNNPNIVLPKLFTAIDNRTTQNITTYTFNVRC
jgi:hypothetical protein